MFDYDSLCSGPRTARPSRAPIYREVMTHICVPSPNCALSWVLVHFRIRSVCLGKLAWSASCIRTVLQTALPRECNVGQARAPAVASTPARRFCATRPCTLCFLDHVPSAVWSFVLAKLATDSSTTHAGRTSRRLLASWITSRQDFIDLNRSSPLSRTLRSHSFHRKTACVKLVLWLRCPPTPQREATRSRALREERPSSSRQVA